MFSMSCFIRARKADKHDYVTIVQFVIDTMRAKTSDCDLRNDTKICVNNLHIIGDIYDRGPAAPIMEE